MPFASAVLSVLVLMSWSVAPAHAADAARTPDLAKGAAYLTAPGNLIDGEYYESFPRTADFGLTIDGAFALAATGKNLPDLQMITRFLDHGGKDPSGRTVNDWTGIGTKSANGGSIAKEALFAEVVGDNPRRFGGHNLIAALDDSVCGAAAAAAGPCAGAGNYRHATSVFSQAIGVIAQVRAGQAADAHAPTAYLEGLRNPDGSFPSLIPDSHDHDLDSTAIAVMALALVRSPQASADVSTGLTWIAARQLPSGGFRGTGGVSVNSAGLAIQALSLRAAKYRSQIASAETFLAGQQNSDGGFNAYAGGQPGSDVRASTQAVSGATGISFGTLTEELNSSVAGQKPGPGRPRPVSRCTATAGATVIVDFAHWGGPLLRACGSTPTTGLALLNQGGWHTSGTEHDGPGFVCRIGYAGFRHGTQYPTPRQDPCVNTPPANAYWTYWTAGPGQNTWSYSQLGAMTYQPPPGSVSLWIFGGTTISGSSGSAKPAFTPDRVRALAVAAPPVSLSSPASRGSYSSVLVTAGIVAIIALAALFGLRRRRKLDIAP
jgi:hypothetical protein